MSLYSVELTVPADNSWVLDMHKRIEELREHSGNPEVPVAKAIGGSGSGELVLRWTDLEARGAASAARRAIKLATEMLPPLATSHYLTVNAKHQEPGRRPV